MKIIAISENNRRRVILCGDIYILQAKIGFIPNWMDRDQAKEEWIASKWIIENHLKVCEDYPTIKEIRKEQEND